MTFAATIFTLSPQKPLPVRGGGGEGCATVDRCANPQSSQTHPSIPSLKGGEV
jgi:hypothetical protein